jgi:hypothetical protein
MDAVAAKPTTCLWSIQPVKRPEVSESTKPNTIDHFRYARLAAHNLPVNPVASPQTLIRRASMLLTGWPATPARIDAFVAAWHLDSAQAYATLLDERFASPHYGERWAQHWLDVIRSADTWADHIKVIFPATRTTALRFQFTDANFALHEIEAYASTQSAENLNLRPGTRVTSSKREETPSTPPSYLIDARLDNLFGWKYEVAEGESDPWIHIRFPKETERTRADLSVNRLAHSGWQYMLNRQGEPIAATGPKTLVAIEALTAKSTWQTVATH